jgi:hypothetical protein
MILHSNNQDWASCFVISTEPVFAGEMDLVDFALALGDLVWPELFIPFDPVPPHLDYLLSLEFSRYRESCHRVDVGVELSSLAN